MADTAFTFGGFLLLSHVYRGFIIRQGWLKLLFNRLLWRLILSSFILGLLTLPISLLALFIFDRASFGQLISSGEMMFSVLLQSVIVGTFLFFCWSVVYFLYHYVTSYNRNLKWEAMANEFELNRLRSQLNPHFLFNALNSVKALVDEDPERAKESIHQLSNILRNSLMMERKKMIDFKEELTIVQDYLRLEKTRFEERLQYSIEAEPETAKVQVPPLMLQTLVENGIKHGIARLKNGGSIQLKAWVTDNFLHCHITNSGQLQHTKQQTTGYGLKSTRQRLELLFQQEARFSIANADKEHVRVELQLPI